MRVAPSSPTQHRRVLHPVGVVALGEILARMRAARFLAVLRGHDRRHRLAEQVLQFERFDQVRIPHQRTIRHAHVGEGCVDVADLVHAFCKCLAGAEHRRVQLHGPLHLVADLGRRRAAVGVAQAVEVGQRRVARVRRQRLVRLARAIVSAQRWPRRGRTRPGRAASSSPAGWRRAPTRRPPRRSHTGPARLVRVAALRWTTSPW